jgi:hypothetical protein
MKLLQIVQLGYSLSEARGIVCPLQQAMQDSVRPSFACMLKVVFYWGFYQHWYVPGVALMPFVYAYSESGVFGTFIACVWRFEYSTSDMQIRPNS